MISLVPALKFAFILLAWELNWRAYSWRALRKLMIIYAVVSCILFSPLYLREPEFYRVFAIAVFAWLTGGATRRLFGKGPPYSWRLPSLTEG